MNLQNSEIWHAKKINVFDFKIRTSYKREENLAIVENRRTRAD